MNTKAMTASDASLICERVQRQKTMQTIFDEGEWLTAGRINAAQPSPPEGRSLPLDDWKAGGRIFSVRFNGIEYSAGYQFGAPGQPLPVNREILDVLGPCADTWKIAAWFHFPSGWIGAAGCGSEAIVPVAPKDALDRRADVLAAAQLAPKAIALLRSAGSNPSLNSL